MVHRPLPQHPGPLSDGHADPRPVLGPTVKDALGFVEAAAGKQQLSHALTVARPLLDFEEVAMVSEQRFAGFFSDQSFISCAGGRAG